jgi:hypothetical protein
VFVEEKVDDGLVKARHVNSSCDHCINPLETHLSKEEGSSSNERSMTQGG